MRERRSKENRNSHRRSLETNFDHPALTHYCSADAVGRWHRYDNDEGNGHRHTLAFALIVILYFIFRGFVSDDAVFPVSLIFRRRRRRISGIVVPAVFLG